MSLPPPPHRSACLQTYTLAEVEERWRVLMYNPTASQNALQDMHAFAQIPDNQSQGAAVPFSRDEQLILTRIDSLLNHTGTRTQTIPHTHRRGSTYAAADGDSKGLGVHGEGLTGHRALAQEGYRAADLHTHTHPHTNTRPHTHEYGRVHTHEYVPVDTCARRDLGGELARALQQLLGDHRTVFHPSRTVAQLEQHIEDLRLSGVWNMLIKLDSTRERSRTATAPGSAAAGAGAAATEGVAMETSNILSGKRRQKDRIKDTDSYKAGSGGAGTLGASESLSNVHVHGLVGNEGAVLSFEDYEKALIDAHRFGWRRITALPERDECSEPECCTAGTAKADTKTRPKSHSKRSFSEAFPPEIEMELAMTDRHAKHKLRILEKLTDSWQWTALDDAKVHATTKLRMFGAESKSLAHIFGEKLDQHMTSKVVYFGRSNCDVNLAFEGRSLKISRLQGAIKLKSNLRFYLYNYGKREIYVNGVAVNKGERLVLNHMALIEIFEYKLLFSVNLALLSDISHDVINAVVSQYDAKK
ncbi:hypothetical protein SARC_13014 [Sphaeroforma arctica JP610]|uniref:FHA domain-containing protein n=1 Tax=Sphaeroforma arctica JP610 TaxID=667725 RepID=A0A0L0FCD4_9EUKA|nr:hypothetical protein SARC_13014 [Sphaeroforma arctica JP610]KNC74437.1 hypothetical protein SARC_13014 [Sphaeroforma arctica JP610]|eukprot:XP_014148339.1 hypothetical protein SARC_13014 [Sphaeroforma arctica JP610]